MALSYKQRIFCEEYLKDGNATQAAIRAGYAPRSANRTGSLLLSKHDIKAYLGQIMAQEEAHRIADAEECRAILTAIARGEVTAEAFRFDGRGKQVKDTLNAPISERIKAAETLLKVHKQIGEPTENISVTFDYGPINEDKRHG